ncbi:MAG: glycosyltransferase family 4 protein [Lachnospiraceae bacterium]|nr:glycosyltransferase family 4 protein [Lachnospiraceae bacterium]
MKKVMMIGNSYLSIFGLRLELIKQLIEEEYEVWTIFPNGTFGNGEQRSNEIGCHFINVSLSRRGKNLFQEIRLFVQYFKVIRKVRPDLILAYTVKPIVYTGIICRIFHIPFMPNITGLGEALKNSRFIKYLYKAATKNAECIFFQNMQDRIFFEKNNFNYKYSVLLPGSGVNLSQYQVYEYPDAMPVKFTYVARVMKAKGIEEFLEAAVKMKAMHNEKVEFHVCGICEEEYEGMMNQYQKKGIIVYHGFVYNIKEYYQKAHCIIMPSYYPEGMSNVLLEAAAAGRPIITTDRVGCREAVENGKTGYLIRERDSTDLFHKMNKFLSLSYQEKKNMGLMGRDRIEKKFDRKVVVDAYMECIRKIGRRTNEYKRND